MNHYFPTASRLIYGCMGLGGQWDKRPVGDEHIKQARALIDTALESGINVFDHADIYTLGKAELAFGGALKQAPHLRDSMIIQSKCAIRFEDEQGPKRYDFSHDWIVQSVENSLRRLGTEQLDILLLHRPDPLMEADEVAAAVASLQQAGKIKHLGVSNMHHHQMKYLQSVIDTPIIVNQLEMSLAFRDWLEDGITTNSEHNRSMGYAPGTIEHCVMEKVALQAWGSLAQGRFTGAATSTDQEKQTAKLVSTLSAEYGVTREAIVLAWLMRHPAHIQPVVGSTNTERVAACAQAGSVNLSREHWYALLECARGAEVP